MPGKWRRVHAGNKSGDLSISSVAHSLMYTAKYELCGENLPHMGPLEALICVIITLNLSIIIHTK